MESHESELASSRLTQLTALKNQFIYHWWVRSGMFKADCRMVWICGLYGWPPMYSPQADDIVIVTVPTRGYKHTANWASSGNFAYNLQYFHFHLQFATPEVIIEEEKNPSPKTIRIFPLDYLEHISKFTQTVQSSERPEH